MVSCGECVRQGRRTSADSACITHGCSRFHVPHTQRDPVQHTPERACVSHPHAVCAVLCLLPTPAFINRLLVQKGLMTLDELRRATEALPGVVLNIKHGIKRCERGEWMGWGDQCVCVVLWA